MIVVGQPQHLGQRTLLLSLSRKTTLAFVLCVASGLIAVIGPSLAVGITGVIALGGTISGSTVGTIYRSVMSFDVILFLGSIVLFLVTMIIGLMQYRNFFFVLEEFSLKMRKGILNKEEISIPYRQIQDINLVRTLSHRIFGVSRLILITAGHENIKEHDETDTVFDPIDANLADEIRTFLERKIGVQVVEGTTQADTEEVAEESSESASHIEHA